VTETRTVLVTGAGGFIGGRLVEALHTVGRDRVRAGIRRWASAARIGRLPVDIVMCDVTDPAQVSNAMKDVTHVIHCAVGDHRTTVTGTLNLLAAARHAGVRHVVHLSTTDVYGLVRQSLVDESCPPLYSGRSYGDSKIDAEKACMDYAAEGHHVTIIRPAMVYGPFSTIWTIALAGRLQSPPWRIAREDAEGSCNLLYVDDLVRALLRVVEVPVGSGEAFNINGPERLTWNQYFDALNAALGLPPLETEPPGRAHRSALAMLPVRRLAKLMLKHFEPQIMAMYQRFDIAKALMKRAEQAIRRTPTPDEFALYSNPAIYSIAKAERLIGWHPQVGMQEGLRISVNWLRCNGYVRVDPSPVRPPS
jgi:nucleoside-diphosphate-sugar epimerase